MPLGISANKNSLGLIQITSTIIPLVSEDVSKPCQTKLLVLKSLMDDMMTQDHSETEESVLKKTLQDVFCVIPKGCREETVFAFRQTVPKLEKDHHAFSGPDIPLDTLEKNFEGLHDDVCNDFADEL
jgi:hypothetical protein